MRLQRLFCLIGQYSIVSVVRRTGSSADPDGNGTLNGIDLGAGRNAFTAPAYVNLDMRFTKRFDMENELRCTRSSSSSIC